MGHPSSPALSPRGPAPLCTKTKARAEGGTKETLGSPLRSFAAVASSLSHAVIFLNVRHDALLHENLVGVEKVIDVDVVHDVEAKLGNVPSAQVEALVVLALGDQENLLAVLDPKVRERAHHRLGSLVLKHVVEVGNNGDARVRGGVGEGGAQGELPLLLVHLGAVVPGFRAEDDATAGNERGPLGPAPRASRALLRVGLPPASANLASRLRARRALALVAKDVDDVSVNEPLGALSGALQVEGRGSRLLARLAENGDLERSARVGKERDRRGVSGVSGRRAGWANFPKPLSLLLSLLLSLFPRSSRRRTHLRGLRSRDAPRAHPSHGVDFPSARQRRPREALSRC